MTNRIHRLISGLVVGSLVLGASCAVMAEIIRYSPGADAPIAYNAATGIYQEGASFDPLYCAEEPCVELLHNIFEPLVKTTPGQFLEPVLATGWKRRDPVTYRFTLRRGVHFHNGERFDAEAVRFSLMRAAEAYSVTAWFSQIDRVDILGPYSVDVVLKEPDSLFLYRLANIGLILPPRYIRRVGPAEFGVKPVGTGAFQFVRWNAARREVHLKANHQYWRRGYPKIDRLIYTYMETDRALDLLVEGKLDVIRRLSPRKTTQFMTTGSGQIVKAWLPQLVLGPFNLLKPRTPLKDLRVRQAINLAINREHLIRYGTIGNGRLLGGYTVPEDPNHAGLEPYPFDIGKARRLLRDAGYSEGFALSIMVDRQVPPQIENIISVSLREIGITIEVKRATESEFLEELYLPKFGSKSPPSFDILVLSMPVGTIFHSAMVPMTLLYSRKPNESALRDSVLDRLYEDAIGTRHPGNDAALWQALEKYVHENHLLFIGYQEKAVYGAKQSLHFTPRTLMTFWDAYYEQ